MLWDHTLPSSTTMSVPSSSTTTLSTPCTPVNSLQGQIEESIHAQWSPDQAPLAPPHVWGCSSWETAPVFRRRLDSQTTQAFVPMAKLNQDFWGIVLLAEEDSDNDEDQNQTPGSRRMAWKYHHLLIVTEQALIAEQSWKRVSGCCPPSATAHTPTVQPANLIIGDDNGDDDDDGDDDNDDSDDDYWGQYGDTEDASTEETAPEDTGFSRDSPKKVTDKDEDEDDDDDDDYWCKYGDQEHEDESESDGTGHQDSPSETLDDGSEAGSEPRRFFACLDEAAHGNSDPVIIDPAGQVDATTLTMLLERLITHSDEEGVPRILAGRDNDADGSTDNEDDNDAYFEMQEHPVGENESLHFREVEAQAEIFESSSQSREGDLSSAADSVSRSPSQPTSFVSCSSSGTNTAGESTSAPSMVMTPMRMALHEPNRQPSSSALLPTSSSSSSASPLSTLSCTDSAYQEDSEDPFNKISSSSLGPGISLGETAVTPTEDSVRVALQMAVRKATVSGMSKKDLLEMLDVIYDASNVQAA